jgi:uncharacterized protein (DUF2237 family)
MLRDDRAHGEDPRGTPRNVLGERLEVCSIDPMTGFFRDGCCNTAREDVGSHTVCAVMTADFLAFSKSRGNDLSTSIPQLGFRGLNPATGGACARRAGRKRSTPVRRPAWSCAPPTKAPWTIARSPISSAWPSTFPEPGRSGHRRPRPAAYAPFSALNHALASYVPGKFPATSRSAKRARHFCMAGIQ